MPKRVRGLVERSVAAVAAALLATQALAADTLFKSEPPPHSHPATASPSDPQRARLVRLPTRPTETQHAEAANLDLLRALGLTALLGTLATLLASRERRRRPA